jgi:hypothetical protein
MFCTALRQHVIGVPVTTGTGLLRDILWIDHFKGLMRRVAGETIGLGHLL